MKMLKRADVLEKIREEIANIERDRTPCSITQDYAVEILQDIHTYFEYLDAIEMEDES